MEKKNSPTDYYALLGVGHSAEPAEIKAAFKKLALQYHPDIYKGEDAQERMRLLLRAYQALNDPVKRKEYDAGHLDYSDARHAAHVEHERAASTRANTQTKASSKARRDRQRNYDFPDLAAGKPAHIDLREITYTLSAQDARELVQQGMLRGIAPTTETPEHDYFCHRCHQHWSTGKTQELPRFCPKCHTMDWDEYLLLRCMHCCAVFESEQIRYAIGAYSYGKASAGTDLCPPYELFPLCPYCGTARWSPAEDTRVDKLRLRVAQRQRVVRAVWISVALMVLLVIGALALGLLR